MNGQSCCRVNLCRHLIPLSLFKYWYIIQDIYPKYYQRWSLADITYQSGYFCVGDLYCFLVCIIYYHKFCFFRKICEFQVCLDLQHIFPIVTTRSKLGKPWFLNLKLTVLFKQVCMTKAVIFAPRNKMVLNSSVLNTMIHMC